MTETTPPASIETKSKGAVRSCGVVGSSGVIVAVVVKLIWGVDLDDGLQLAITENIDEWVILIAGTIALIGRLRAAAHITSLW